MQIPEGVFIRQRLFSIYIQMKRGNFYVRKDLHHSLV